MTLKEFLAQNRISRATFYRLPADDKPRTARISRVAAPDGGGSYRGGGANASSRRACVVLSRCRVGCGWSTEMISRGATTNDQRVPVGAPRPPDGHWPTTGSRSSRTFRALRAPPKVQSRTRVRGRTLAGWSPRNHPFCPSPCYTALCRPQPHVPLAQKAGSRPFSTYRPRMRGPRQIG
jgi:hypothetical protein